MFETHYSILPYNLCNTGKDSSSPKSSFRMTNQDDWLNPTLTNVVGDSSTHKISFRMIMKEDLLMVLFKRSMLFSHGHTSNFVPLTSYF
jgi:hypothetical protein